jgi:hypothetical protein
MDIKTVTIAGVTKTTRKPFHSMINRDQMNGINGIIEDDKADVGAKITKSRVKNLVGVLRTPYERTISTANAY